MSGDGILWKSDLGPDPCQHKCRGVQHPLVCLAVRTPFLPCGEEKWDVLGHITRTVGSLCFCAVPAAVEVFSMLRPAQGQTELMKST